MTKNSKSKKNSIYISSQECTECGYVLKEFKNEAFARKMMSLHIKKTHNTDIIYGESLEYNKIIIPKG